MTKEIILTFVL